MIKPEDILRSIMVSQQDKLDVECINNLIIALFLALDHMEPEFIDSFLECFFAALKVRNSPFFRSEEDGHDGAFI